MGLCGGKSRGTVLPDVEASCSRFAEEDALGLTLTDCAAIAESIPGLTGGKDDLRVKDICERFKFEHTDYLERVFNVLRHRSIDPKKASDDEPVTLTKYVFSVWNYCTMEAASLLTFVFCLYDAKQCGKLPKERLLKLVSEMYDLKHDHHAKGEDTHDNTETHAMRVLAGREHEKGVSGGIVGSKLEEYHIDDFMRLNDKYPMILYRAFETQKELRKHVCGEGFWQRHLKARKEIKTIKGKEVDAAWDTKEILEAMAFRNSYVNAREQSALNLLKKQKLMEDEDNEEGGAGGGGAEEKGEAVEKTKKKRGDGSKHSSSSSSSSSGGGGGGGGGSSASSKDKGSNKPHGNGSSSSGGSGGDRRKSHLRHGHTESELAGRGHAGHGHGAHGNLKHAHSAKPDDGHRKHRKPSGGSSKRDIGGGGGGGHHHHHHHHGGGGGGGGGSKRKSKMMVHDSAKMTADLNKRMGVEVSDKYNVRSKRDSDS